MASVDAHGLGSRGSWRGRAPLLYQHAADDRDADIARALDAMLRGIDVSLDEDSE